MRNLILPFTAGAAIVGCRIVKVGAADGTAIQAAAATDALLGVSDPMGAAAGKTCDVHLNGTPDVEYGGPVTRGARLTSDAQGRAIVAAPAAGATVEIIGRALVAGVLGDRQAIHLSPSTYTRPA